VQELHSLQKLPAEQVEAAELRPPSPAQIRLGRELQAELGRLNLLCGELLERMEFLDAEARRLAAVLEEAPHPAR
ncbi:MAG TPA: hypothetical protein VHJ78_13575, partial [Actinomycetota bacterium]|nr:hypothetical protein [Actinomycetota bacterium]